MRKTSNVKSFLPSFLHINMVSGKRTVPNLGSENMTAEKDGGHNSPCTGLALELCSKIKNKGSKRGSQSWKIIIITPNSLLQIATFFSSVTFSKSLSTVTSLLWFTWSAGVHITFQWPPMLRWLSINSIICDIASFWGHPIYSCKSFTVLHFTNNLIRSGFFFLKNVCMSQFSLSFYYTYICYFNDNRCYISIITCELTVFKTLWFFFTRSNNLILCKAIFKLISALQKLENQIFIVFALCIYTKITSWFISLVLILSSLERWGKNHNRINNVPLLFTHEDKFHSQFGISHASVCRAFL